VAATAGIRLQLGRAAARGIKKKENTHLGKRQAGVARADCMIDRAFPAPGRRLCICLIAAAGSGRRHGAREHKLCAARRGRPWLAWSLEAALACRAIRWIGLWGQPVGFRSRGEALMARQAAGGPAGCAGSLAAPGRPGVVRLGLAACPAEADRQCLIHDGAPLAWASGN